MERELVGKRPTFHQNKRSSNFYRVIVLIAMIMAGVWILVGFERGQVRPAFQPTPTPTRIPASFIMEAEAYVNAGKLDDPSNNQANSQGPAVNDAIEAYKAGLEIEPNNAKIWAELARIQAYSARMLRNDKERLTRLKEALESADKAQELAPDDSEIHAIHAFVLDWYAYNSLVPPEEGQEMLVQAEREASRAFQLDPENALALAYYAEILADQAKWLQAEKFAIQAVQKNPNLMDTHRVYAYVLETLGQYNAAIQEYQAAAAITPNLTFLYITIGQNYREGIKNPELALEFFDKAAKINEQLGIQNPLPYIEIAKTYTQQGEFFAAAINAEKALSYDNTNASTYGQLGIIFIRARNYEGALPLLRCAVRGCEPEDNEMGQAKVEGIDLTNLSVAYYYVEYGTVLAFLSRPNENYCPEAREVFREITASYSDDPTLMAIVADSEGICRNLEGGGAGSAPASTETVDSTETVTGTTTPEAVETMEPAETEEPKETVESTEAPEAVENEEPPAP